MLFQSPIFLFLFCPILFLSYFIVARKYRNYILLFFSLIFYAWGEPRFIFVVLVSATIDWLLGNKIYGAKDLLVKRAMLTTSIVLNLGILVYFKYFTFLLDNANQLMILMHINPIVYPKVLLPIGISFIVFEKITYTVDIYRGVGRPAPIFTNYLLYVFLFPKLLAGPIIKYHDIEKQLSKREANLDSVIYGTVRFAVGLAKKVFIADAMGEVVDVVFKLSSGDLGFYNAWLGVICFTLQIYFDFSAYSDMAIGLSRIFGFRLLENFNMPYISQNFTEFWRRWHISLSTWIRDYLYFPLGGNRVSTSRLYFNLWFCFLLSGLWHGAKWTFVLWGIYHGFFLIIDKLFWLRLQNKLPEYFRIAITFFLVMIGWVIFRSESFYQMAYYVSAMFAPMVLGGKLVYLTNDIKFFMGLGLMICFIPISRVYQIISNWVRNIPYYPELQLFIAALLMFFAICKVSSVTFSPFLYFRF